MLTTSQTLLERLRDKESNAWERFVRLYTPLLMVWTRRQGFREADADDLVQEVLVRLVQKLPTYQPDAGRSFRGWLFRVCFNQCQDFRRRKATRLLPGAEGLSAVSDGLAGEALEETEYRRLLVSRALELIRGDFNETTWAAFQGVMVEERTAAEVATALNLSVGNVYQARHRVLKRLREEIDGMLE
jgi:RNA polymerase sigma-70 factor (ECF subfamily)